MTSSTESTINQEASTTALEQLKVYLKAYYKSRPSLDSQAFAKTILTKEDAATIERLLWRDFAEYVGRSRAVEIGNDLRGGFAEVDNVYLYYHQHKSVNNPEGGRSLFISMHGGGATTSYENDTAWKEQMQLTKYYKAQDAMLITPRAPFNTWDMWFKTSIDPVFDQLITNMVIYHGVNPNKVYLMGHSAGGDGAYQLGARMADRWAGVSMSAGHPNDARPENLRNLAFVLNVGALDTAYDRHLKGREWANKLKDLRAKDPEGYINQCEIHEGLGHVESAKEIKTTAPFLQQHIRNPKPKKIVWTPTYPQTRSYWLALDAVPTERPTIIAEHDESSIRLSGTGLLKTLRIRLSDSMLDLDKPVKIYKDDKEIFYGLINRTISTIYHTLNEREDQTAMFSGEQVVSL